MLPDARLRVAALLNASAGTWTARNSYSGPAVIAAGTRGMCLNMHRRTLQRILVKRTPIVCCCEERSARRVDATRLTVWWAKYGRP
jgi:hypothetical protein